MKEKKLTLYCKWVQEFKLQSSKTAHHEKEDECWCEVLQRIIHLSWIYTSLKTVHLTWYWALNRVFCVPSLCHLFGSIVLVGCLFSNSHPAPPLLLFSLFGQQSIVESHSSKQEDTGDEEDDPTALVGVLVVVVDVFELACWDKKSNISSSFCCGQQCNFNKLHVNEQNYPLWWVVYSPSNGGPNNTGPHSTIVTSPTALEKRWAPTRSIKVSNSTELSQPKANPKKMA